MRYTTRLFPCKDIGQFQRAVEKAAAKLEYKFRSSKKDTTGTNSLIVELGTNGVSLDCSHGPHIVKFLREVSWAMEGLPYLEARIQEGSHWDYSLMRGMHHLDQFSTFPQYWEGEEDPIEILYNRGRPEMISLAFGVPVGKFDRYLRHWYSDWDAEIDGYRTKLEGRAYPNDKCPYGNYEQLFDFVRAIGFYDLDEQSRQRFEWTLDPPQMQPDVPQRRKFRLFSRK